MVDVLAIPEVKGTIYKIEPFPSWIDSVCPLIKNDCDTP
jgi:hypothetical protein